MSTNARKNTDKTMQGPEKGPPKLRRKVKPTGEASTAAAPEKKPKAVRKTPEPAPQANKSATEHSETPEIVNPTPEMEVHHHPQLEHKPKPIKEYLLEGFMIFIAVMMGFIAENIRENIDNNEQVQQLTSQLAQDLKADTATLNEHNAGIGKTLMANDSLFYFLQQPLAKADTKKIQKFAIDSHSIWLFHPSGGAIAAIKNELHLKKFSNSKIISYIARYEEHIELIHAAQDIALVYQRNYLDPFLSLHFTPANLNAAFNNTVIPNGQMRNLTQVDMTQLAADMVLIKANTNEMIRDNKWLKEDAINLLQYVRKQYNPDEE